MGIAAHTHRILLPLLSAGMLMGGWERDRCGLFVASAFLCALLSGWLAWSGRRFSRWEILVWALVLRAAVFPLPPSLSDDAYRYLWDGWVQAEGGNPYVAVPADLPDLQEAQPDLFSRMNSQDRHSVYPPLSQLLFRPSGWWLAQGGEIVPAFYLLKLLFGVPELLALVVLLRTVPSRPLVLLYAWSPLPAVEVWGQGHTEGAGLVFLVLGFVFLERKRPLFASAAWSAAAWVKLWPAMLLPLLLRRFSWKCVAVAAAVSLGLSAALWIPFFERNALPGFGRSLSLYLHTFEFSAGIYLALEALFNLIPVLADREMGGWAAAHLLHGVFLCALAGVFLVDRRGRVPAAHLGFAVMAAAVLCSAVVHPWYLLLSLVLIPYLSRTPWHWIWLTAVYPFSYLIYAYPAMHSAIAAGIWGSWLAVLLFEKRKGLVDILLRFRARGKARLLERALREAGCRLAGETLLDVGAGEGYVGMHLASRWGVSVHLADVRNANRTQLPCTVYSGETLPFEDASFDVVASVYTLHHCRDSETVASELLRVARGPVVVMESVYRRPLGLSMLAMLDRWANRLRPEPGLRGQEEQRVFRADAAWAELFENLGAVVLFHEERLRFLHRSAVWVLRRGRRDGPESGQGAPEAAPREAASAP